MKTLFLLFALAITVLPIDYANASFSLVGRSAVEENDGSLKSGSLEKCYFNVKNTSGGSVNDGTLFVWETTEDDGYSVTTSTTAGATPACVLAKDDGSACADDEVCKCQAFGLNAGVLFDSTNDSSTAGEGVYLSENNAGYVQATLLSSVAASDVRIGHFYDTVSASADAEVFLTLPCP